MERKEFYGEIKKVIVGVIMAVAVICTTNVVRADSVSDITSSINSPNLVSGKWWSGFDTGDIYSLKSSYSTVYDGEVGVWFFTPSVGMPSTFYRTSSRIATIQLKENDPAEGDENELVRTYKGNLCS